MNAVVVFESIYGSTRAVAEAVAEGLGGVRVLPVHLAAREPIDAELLVVGGLTRERGLVTARGRHDALAAAPHKGAIPVEPAAGEEPGLRAWLRDLHRHDGVRAAAFETRIDKAPWLTGVAARGIARRLRRHGYDVVSIASFLVDDPAGHVPKREVDRARAWGQELAQTFAGRSGPLGAAAG